MKAVYTIGILDFEFDEDKDTPDKYLYNVKLTDIETHKVFHDKLSFIYIAMPKFNKKLAELSSYQDKWLYALKNLTQLEGVPDGFRDEVFLRFFKAAEVAKLKPVERHAYEQSLKYYRDMKNVISTAVEEGTDALREEMTLALNEERRQKEEERRQKELLKEKLLASGMTEDELKALLNA